MVGAADPVTRPGIGSPRAAGVAGVVFSLLLGLVVVLLATSEPSNSSTPGAWLADPSRRRTVDVVLNLVPFAGIAFLWFVGVLKDRIGRPEDKFFGSVFLGSGLLFVAMLFVGTALAAGLTAQWAAPAEARPGADMLGFGRQVTWLLLRVYGMRMAAVFIMSTATSTLRSRTVPRWIGITGIPVALVLLVGVGLGLWAVLLFPAWILLFSLGVLRTGLRWSADVPGPGDV